MPPASPPRPSPPAPPRRRWLWPIALSLSLILSSALFQPQAPEGFALLRWDKLAHFLYFGLLATLVARSWRGPRPGLASFWLTLAYASTDETLQAFNPERFASLADLAADTLGAALALLLYRACPPYRRLLEARL